jgi:hypothetical protein
VIALVFGGLVAVSAAAAGGMFLVKHRLQAQLATVTTTPAAQPASPSGATPSPDTAPAATAMAGDPSTAGNDSTPGNNGRALAAKGASVKGPRVAINAPPQAAPPKEEPAKVSQAELPRPATAGASGSLGDEMKKAVGDKDKPDQVPAAGPSNGSQFAPGSVPTKPSQGAVTGALGAVMPAARQCLGPDDPISRAVVVFGSNGAVQSVSVSGGAAGKPAEACIKSALSHARVAPFAEATYSAPVTIRH